MTAYLGVDLAWGLGTERRAPNETGLAALDDAGRVTDAGWARGVDEVTAWIAERLGPRTLIAVDASLVVTNPTGIRESERQVGQRYGRWKVAANPTNLASAASAGARLLDRLTALGVPYVSDTRTMRARSGPAVFECYPYTTLVGVAEFGYDVERPRYKRLDTSVPPAVARQRRAEAFDEARPPHAYDGVRPAPRPRRAPAHPRPPRPVGAARADAQAPRGPARRRPLRVDGGVLGATRRRTGAGAGW